MELYAKHFKIRTGMSETAQINRVVLLCYFLCALCLTFMGAGQYPLNAGDAFQCSINGMYYVLLWAPIIICKCNFYRLCKGPVLMRNIIFSIFLVFYGYALLTDGNYACVLIAIPFLIMTVSYGSLYFSATITIIATLFTGAYTLFPYIFNHNTESILFRFYAYLAVFATSLFLNVMAYIIEKSQDRRRQLIENEKNKLKSLASVGLNRIFEYEIDTDVLSTARSRDDEYIDERSIENFSTVAKQFRYVLLADWDKLDSVIEAAQNGEPVIETQLRIRDEHGDYKWYEIKGRAVSGSEDVGSKIVGYMDNIDEIKRIELRQADENKRDSLTKLYRFQYVRELICEYLTEQSESERPDYAGLLILDIDNFAILNDRMGKAFGDEILKNIASDLDDIFYTSDVLGRIGGDEFIILMKNIKDVDHIDMKIREIQRVINRTYVGENVSFGSTVGIGAAVYPSDGEDFETLYEKAEKALFHAKSAGKNCYGFYAANKENVYKKYPIEEKRKKLLLSEEDSKSNNSDSLIELAFKLIDESKDTDSAINLLIRQVARQMNLGGICIKSRMGKEFRTVTLYHCTTVPELELDDSDMSFTMDQWSEMLEEYRIHNNLIVYNNIQDIDNKMLRQLTLSMGASAYVGCAFFDKGEFAGNIDFIDFDNPRVWTNEDLVTVRAVANVVSSYLLKMKAYEDASDTVERLTGYDRVTGLLMYEKFLTLAGEYIEGAPHGKYAMIYMDFSGFKYVNETYGYETGDKILRSLADEATSYRDYYIFGSRVFSDNLVVFARIGDHPEDELLKVFERISKRFSDRIQRDYIDGKLLLDLGICTFEICGKPIPLKNIISNANLARKKTKNPNSPRCIIYSEAMGNELKAEVTYATDMENAFRNHEFVVYMQPKVNLKTNSIDGAEALVRWKKQDGTLIFPNDFIPVFEKNKSITLLDYYVYDEVCKYIRGRLDAGLPVVRISVNVSRVHLFSIDELVSYVKSLIEKYDINPKYLEFELTETVFTEKVEDTVVLMQKLRELGVLISMDDFGSGYSSLNVLTKLPLDVLKLDKEFLNDFENDPEEKIIIPSVIDMAKKLNLVVVCEGVETMEQVMFLRDVGCDYAQGYFYSKPIPLEQFNELLEV